MSEYEFNGMNSNVNNGLNGADNGMNNGSKAPMSFGAAGSAEPTVFKSPYNNKPEAAPTVAPQFGYSTASAPQITMNDPAPSFNPAPSVNDAPSFKPAPSFEQPKQETFSNPYSYSAPQTPSTSAPAQYTPDDFKPKKQKSGKKWALSVAAICAALVISGGSFYAGAVYNSGSNSNEAQTTTATSQKVATANTVNVSGDSTVVSSTITDVVEQVMPSMVAINTITEEQLGGAYGLFSYYMFGEDFNQTYETSASGSGIIIAQNDTELLIVTNNHVVDGANKIAVQFIDDESYDATVKGTSADNDLAVIAVNISDIRADTLSKIKVATLGSSDSLKLGEPAIAIGNSLGYGQSVTVGYISALNREVQISDRTMSLIQTDAAINPGNSGGALLNVRGEVIGINSAKYSDTSVEGTGYAIPISYAEPIINDLMSENHVSDEDRPYLGIYGQDVPDSYRERFDWPAGVYVSQVTSGSPAALAGVEAGDIITGINGKTVETMDALQEIIENCKVGDKITIDITRSGRNGELKTGTVTATLISRGDAGVED